MFYSHDYVKVNFQTNNKSENYTLYLSPWVVDIMQGFTFYL